MVTLVTLPDGRRPSVCAIVAAGTTQFAESGMPGLLWKAPLSCTPIFGIVYEPAAVARVVIPGAKWQLGFTAL